MIRFTCPSCGKEYTGADELAGRQAACKKCGTLFTIAAGQATQASSRPSQHSKSRQARPTVAPQRQSPSPSSPAPSPSGPAKRLAQKPPRPAAQPAPGDDLGGFNIDLGALGPLDAPALPAASGAPLGGAILGGSGYGKRTKKNNVVPWLIFSGSGLVVVAIIAILVITLVDFSSTKAAAAFPNNPTAYLPPNPVLAASMRVRKLLDRAASIPQLKPQFDQALASAVAEGFNPRDMDEAFIASDGVTTFLAAQLSRPLEIAKLAGVKASGDTHQSLPIYFVKSQPPARPMPRGAGVPNAEDLYFVMPNPQLLVSAGNPQRLKEAIDQAKEGRGTPLDLPTGHDVALRVKDLKKLNKNPALPPDAMSQEVVGLAGTLDWTDTLALNVQVDMKDAQIASQTEQKIKTALQMLGQLAAAAPANAATPNSPGKNAPGGNLFSALSVAASGAQLRISGSLPTDQLAAVMPPTMGAMPGTSGATPMSAGMPPMGAPGSFTMPSGGMPPMGAPGSFAAPGGNAAGTFPAPLGTAPPKQ
jgi:hypothetical protein